MVRAGREVAEDVKRRLEEACREAGLAVGESQFCLTGTGKARWVLVDASPPGWPHALPALDLWTTVQVSGGMDDVQIRCLATDEDPAVAICRAPTLRECFVPLDLLSFTLKAVLAERQTVMAFMVEGRKPPFTLTWKWAVPFSNR
jgi:hypothetical protein